MPPLNEEDEKRKTCSDYPDFDVVLASLPSHEWLRTTSGETVKTADGRTWVSFDVVQEREAKLIKFAGVDAKGAHFVCFDNLKWLSDTYTDLEP